jgi:exodeoxyribonuclease VII large subunit
MTKIGKMTDYYNQITVGGKSNNHDLGYLQTMTDIMTSESRDIYSVTRLVREVRDTIEYSFPPLWIQGEISNLAQPVSGHMYFSLKDKSSQVRCAMFKNRNRFLKFQPENGTAVLVKAKVSLYESRGEFQLIVESLEPEGVGALQLAFEQLKQKLMEEGLFAEEHKKSIPKFPTSIGVITSRSGAAIRDIINVLSRRYPLAMVIIHPVSVQGTGSSEMIEAAIISANKKNQSDVLILARGGGSLEDLRSFNEERVARAIYDSTIPIVTGVGHEIDSTIADFVADQRAPTPSAAAELVAPDIGQLRQSVNNLENALSRNINRTFNKYRDKITYLQNKVLDPGRSIQNYIQRIDELNLRLGRALSGNIKTKHNALLKYHGTLQKLNPLTKLGIYREKNKHFQHAIFSAMRNKLILSKNHLEKITRTLHTVSPLATLDRGYAIVSDATNDKIVKDINVLKVGTETKTRISNGSIYSRITKLEKNEK